MALVEPENRKEADNKVVLRILDLSRDLRADKCIRDRFAAKRAPRVQSGFQRAHTLSGQPEALHIARRGIELAFRCARQEQIVDPRQWVADLDIVADRAKDAAKAIGRFVRALHPNPSTGADLWHALTVISAPFDNIPATDTSIVDLKHGRAIEAEALWLAHTVATRLAEHAQRRSDLFSQTLKNDPLPDEREFTKKLGETWTYLMGRRPGSNPSGNPFLDFVTAAWQDCFGETDSKALNFIGGLRSAIDVLDDKTVDRLVKVGPPWL